MRNKVFEPLFGPPPEPIKEPEPVVQPTTPPPAPKLAQMPMVPPATTIKRVMQTPIARFGEIWSDPKKRWAIVLLILIVVVAIYFLKQTKKKKKKYSIEKLAEDYQNLKSLEESNE